MSSNDTIIIDKGERLAIFFHISRALLLGPNSTSNIFIETTKDNLDTGSEILASDLIRNSTENFNNPV